MIMMFRHSRSPPIQLLLPVLGVLLQLVHSSPVTSPSGLNDGTIAGVRSNMLQVANARYAHPLNSNKIKSTFFQLGTRNGDRSSNRARMALPLRLQQKRFSPTYSVE